MRLAYNESRLLLTSKPGAITIDLANYADGSYQLSSHHSAYGLAMTVIHLSEGKLQERTVAHQLFRKRSVTIHYKINKTGGRDFSPANVIEGTTALVEGEYLPEQRYICIQQRRQNAETSKVPHLAFSIRNAQCGFLLPAESTPFDEMNEAPEAGYKSADALEAVKGRSVYFFTGAEGNVMRYGKLIIVEAAEKPSKNSVIFDDNSKK